jgi:hypothetical protein
MLIQLVREEPFYSKGFISRLSVVSWEKVRALIVTRSGPPWSVQEIQRGLLMSAAI